jgi:hypothetical protein
MSAKITLTHADLSLVPCINQVATVKYKQQTEPDSAFITWTTTAVIDMATGNFTPNVVITGLLNGITYIVRVSDNCSSSIYVDKPFLTPLSACVAITDIQGVASNE